MRDFFLDFEYLAEGFCWYLLVAFDFVADELLAFSLFLASLVEDLIGSVFFLVVIA